MRPEHDGKLRPGADKRFGGRSGGAEGCGVMVLSTTLNCVPGRMSASEVVSGRAQRSASAVVGLVRSDCQASRLSDRRRCVALVRHLADDRLI